MIRDGHKPGAADGERPTNRQARGYQRGVLPAAAAAAPGAGDVHAGRPRPARQAVERRSATLLVYLHRLPRWVPLAVLAALVITGLAVHGVGGGIALAGVALVLLWLAVVSWPSQPPAGAGGPGGGHRARHRRGCGPDHAAEPSLAGRLWRRAGAGAGSGTAPP